jgi:hypothetical protein
MRGFIQEDLMIRNQKLVITDPFSQLPVEPVGDKSRKVENPVREGDAPTPRVGYSELAEICKGHAAGQAIGAGLSAVGRKQPMLVPGMLVFAGVATYEKAMSHSGEVPPGTTWERHARDQDRALGLSAGVMTVGGVGLILSGLKVPASALPIAAAGVASLTYGAGKALE